MVRQKKQTKLSPPYELVLYSINEINGTQMTVQRTTDSRCLKMHVDQLKNANRLLDENEILPPRDYQPPTSDECDILIPKPGADHWWQTHLRLHISHQKALMFTIVRKLIVPPKPNQKRVKEHQHPPSDDPTDEECHLDT